MWTSTPALKLSDTTSQDYSPEAIVARAEKAVRAILPADAVNQVNLIASSIRTEQTSLSQGDAIEIVFLVRRDLYRAYTLAVDARGPRGSQPAKATPTGDTSRRSLGAPATPTVRDVEHPERVTAVHTRAPDLDGVLRRLANEVARVQEQHPELTEQEAIAQVFRDDRTLYQDYCQVTAIARV